MNYMLPTDYRCEAIAVSEKALKEQLIDIVS